MPDGLQTRMSFERGTVGSIPTRLRHTRHGLGVRPANYHISDVIKFARILDFELRSKILLKSGVLSARENKAYCS